MSAFGRGQEVQFFMTELDMKDFLQKVMVPGVFIIIGDTHKNKNPEMYDYNKLMNEIWPSKDSYTLNFFLLNKNIDFMLTLDYSEKLRAYKIMHSKSTTITFLRSAISGKYLLSGRIAAFLSSYEWNKGRKKYEIKQPEPFINWWESLRKIIKKDFTKCYALHANKLKVAVPMWAGHDAVKFYNEGGILAQIKPTKEYPNQITFHPEYIQLKESIKHIKRYL